jgi:hypothetical protein
VFGLGLGLGLGFRRHAPHARGRHASEGIAAQARRRRRSRHLDHRAPGDLYIAGIGPPDAKARREAPEWCLKGLPTVDGYATAILKVATEDEGRSRLGEILR